MRYVRWIILIIILAVVTAFTDTAQSGVKTHTQLPVYVESVAVIYQRCGHPDYYVALSGWDRLEGTYERISNDGFDELLAVIVTLSTLKQSLVVTDITPNGMHCI